jgi:hypothetical protein
VQIDSALRAAGWELPPHPKPVDAIGWPRGPGDGIVIEGDATGSVTGINPSPNLTIFAKSIEGGAARALEDAFDSSTFFGCSAFVDPTLLSDEIQVVVGPRL